VIVAIGRENLVIKNNIISIGHIEYNDYVAGIFLQNSSNNLIQNNVLFEDYSKARSVGIMISDSAFNNISENDISGDYSFGIEIWSLYEPDSCKDNIIYGNDIHHNMCGINNLGYNTTIINNTISHMNSQGISDDGDYTLISGNIITDNGDGSEFSCGIMLTGPLFGASSSYVSDNIISNNNPVGIWILENKNYISDNHISNNIQVGVYIDYSYNNVITRNNFVDNPKNAFFTYGFRPFKNNKFDANYWSEYTGSGKLPKIIIGRRTGLIFLSHSWFDIDWHPAQEPYDIPAV
ncbi:MAG: right-handed parallel beta-helix repeat-containing protein, partial [Thermoplasmatales archaeon]|nr:right-handed parallel beta-helix repeat-containing protein [Thermoplasmatales archaeon]